MTHEHGDSYPKLREVLGDEGFAELARLIRTTYEANEERRLPPRGRGRRDPSRRHEARPIGFVGSPRGGVHLGREHALTEDVHRGDPVEVVRPLGDVRVGHPDRVGPVGDVQRLAAARRAAVDAVPGDRRCRRSMTAPTRSARSRTWSPSPSGSGERSGRSRAPR